MIKCIKFSILIMGIFSLSTFFISCDNDDNDDDNETCNVCGSTSCCNEINTENCCCL